MSSTKLEGCVCVWFVFFFFWFAVKEKEGRENGEKKSCPTKGDPRRNLIKAYKGVNIQGYLRLP